MSTPFNDQWRLRRAPPPRRPARTADACAAPDAPAGQAQAHSDPSPRKPPPREPLRREPLPRDPQRVGVVVRLGKRPRWIDRDT
jgi:hypothetical protein